MSGKQSGGIVRAQAEVQLNRILGSAIFMGREGYKVIDKSAGLLRHIVIETLDGKKPSDLSLLIDFYQYPPSRLEGSNTARKGVNRLREKLRIYYATEGIDDPVSIEIPSGQYVAVFAHNPRTVAQKEIRVGQLHLNRETPDHIGHALSSFDEAIRREDTLADGYAGKANAFLTAILHIGTDDIRGYLANAEALATKALTLDLNSWQAHAALGTIALYRHEWEKAEAAFDNAKRIAPFELHRIASYGPYLVSRGLFEEATELAERYVDEGIDDVVSLTRAGFIFYGLRDYEEALSALVRALEMDPNFWLAHIYLAYTFLARDDNMRASYHIDQARHLGGMNLSQGLNTLILESEGQHEEAEKEFAILARDHKNTNMHSKQLALAHMAFGEAREAIRFLSQSCDELDPFTAWLPIWPLLDPLRRFPEFRALLQKWNYPRL